MIRLVGRGGEFGGVLIGLVGGGGEFGVERAAGEEVNSEEC